MAKESKPHSNKNSWLKNLLLFLAITVLFTGFGVAGGAALGTFAIPFLGTAGGITLFGSIGFGLAMFVGLCGAIKGIKHWFSSHKNVSTLPDNEQKALVGGLSALEPTTLHSPEKPKKNSVVDSIDNYYLGNNKPSRSTNYLANDVPIPMISQEFGGNRSNFEHW